MSSKASSSVSVETRKAWSRFTGLSVLPALPVCQ
jgi:hypothetical protein